MARDRISKLEGKIEENIHTKAQRNKKIESKKTVKET